MTSRPRRHINQGTAKQPTRHAAPQPCSEISTNSTFVSMPPCWTSPHSSPSTPLKPPSHTRPCQPVSQPSTLKTRARKQVKAKLTRSPGMFHTQRRQANSTDVRGGSRSAPAHTSLQPAVNTTRIYNNMYGVCPSQIASQANNPRAAKGACWLLPTTHSLPSFSYSRHMSTYIHTHVEATRLRATIHSPQVIRVRFTL